MPVNRYGGLSIDTTLGGASPSDEVVSSQKAIKEYFDTQAVKSVNNVQPVNGNVTLSIPTVNNPTITITQGGVTKGSFTLNQSTGDTIALDAGGGGGGGSSVTLPDIAIAGTGIQFEGGSSVNYTLYGSPTIDSNYVASNFSASNRILPTMVGFVGQTFANLAHNYTWEFKTKINLNTINVWNSIFGGIAGSWGMDFYVDSSNRLAMNLSSNGTNYNFSGGVGNLHGTTTLSANTDYWLKCGWDGSKYYAELSTDGTNYTTGELSFTSSTPIYSSSYDTYLGFRNEAYLHGSISLADTSFSFNNGQFEWGVVETGKTIISSAIKTNNLFDNKWCDYELNDQNWLRADTFSWQDGTVYSEAYSHLVADYTGGTSKTETVGSYTISYVEATDGHKITTDETTVANIYAESGVAWYYVLDTTNQRFKLPRTKWGFVGVRDSVGKYVPESLPNIKGTSIFSAVSQAFTGEGAFKKSVYGLAIAGTASGNYYKAYLDASDSSSAYQDDAPVQQRATQMYLYFYVGEFSQSATEQTAGLNSSLFNNKMDIDAGNATSSAKETIIGWGISDYEKITTGISFPFTAPKNGTVLMDLYYADGTVGSVSLTSNGTTKLLYDNWARYNGAYLYGYVLFPIELKQGEQISITGFSNQQSRFVEK